MDGRNSIAQVLSTVAILALDDLERICHEGTYSNTRHRNRDPEVERQAAEIRRRREDERHEAQRREAARRQQEYDAVAAPIRAETLSRKQYNFRKRLPKGHPDRIED